MWTGRMKTAPPAIGEASCDRQDEEKRQPPARRVEQSFALRFPPGQRQTEQPEESSKSHTCNGGSEGASDPEGKEGGQEKKKQGGNARHPHVGGGHPSPAPASRRTRAVTQDN